LVEDKNFTDGKKKTIDFPLNNCERKGNAALLAKENQGGGTFSRERKKKDRICSTSSKEKRRGGGIGCKPIEDPSRGGNLRRKKRPHKIQAGMKGECAQIIKKPQKRPNNQQEKDLCISPLRGG